MNKKTISLILLIIFIIGVILSGANILLNDNNTIEKENGTLSITDSKSNKTKTVNYEKTGKCLDVYDGNTIWVYEVGKVQLTQIKIPAKDTASKKFVEEKCLGKIVYLNIDDKNPKDKYDRTLAIVYTENEDINKELINNDLAEISYFEPSEFKKGEI